ncbi:hypothetical protein AQUCO_04400108v1 [Aquilegia coerulea]|uniref:Uncharacterized protein n=1 Tax=Aquilegia coerulea TaxID=218851 RepID=A0A2G5CN11_AQUCA|nr:hypothetical protein AQUCO_04400108v1 [Aquilegia coerulea]
MKKKNQIWNQISNTELSLYFLETKKSLYIFHRNEEEEPDLEEILYLFLRRRKPDLEDLISFYEMKEKKTKAKSISIFW